MLNQLLQSILSKIFTPLLKISFSKNISSNNKYIEQKLIKNYNNLTATNLNKNISSQNSNNQSNLAVKVNNNNNNTYQQQKTKKEQKIKQKLIDTINKTRALLINDNNKNNKDICFYLYNAKLIKVIDGDTIDLLIDLGFSTLTKKRIRLLYINTYELHSKNKKYKELAYKGKDYTINWFKKYNNQCIIQTIKESSKNNDDKKGRYGRYLGIIYSPDLESCLNLDLLNNNLARVYDK